MAVSSCESDFLENSPSLQKMATKTMVSISELEALLIILIDNNRCFHAVKASFLSFHEYKSKSFNHIF